MNPLTPTDLVLYRSGKTPVRLLANKYGVSRQTIRVWLEEATAAEHAAEKEETPCSTD